jgi:hypothetical protein
VVKNDASYRQYLVGGPGDAFTAADILSAKTMVPVLITLQGAHQVLSTPHVSK